MSVQCRPASQQNVHYNMKGPHTRQPALSQGWMLGCTACHCNMELSTAGNVGKAAVRCYNVQCRWGRVIGCGTYIITQRREEEEGDQHCNNCMAL